MLCAVEYEFMLQSIFKILKSFLKSSVVEQSAGGLIISWIDGEQKMLMVRNKQGYVFPKGHIEDGESPEQAALREVREETGYVDLQIVQKLGVIHRRPGETNSTYSIKDIMMFLIDLKSNKRLTDFEESCDWLSFNAAMEKMKYTEDKEFLQGLQFLFKNK